MIENSVEVNVGNRKIYVQEDGTVYSDLGHKYTWTDNGAGYKKVAIGEKGSTKTHNRYIHRLVAQCYIPNPDDHKQVNHINGDKSDNHVSNLEWVSNKQNIRHAHNQGLMNNRRRLTSTTTRSDRTVASAYISYRLGKGLSESARDHNMPRTTLSSIVNKRSRRSVTDRIDEVFLTINP